MNLEEKIDKLLSLQKEAADLEKEIYIEKKNMILT